MRLLISKGFLGMSKDFSMVLSIPHLKLSLNSKQYVLVKDVYYVKYHERGKYSP